MPEQETATDSFNDVLDHLALLLRDGIREGFFDVAIEIRRHTHAKCRVRVSAGRCTQFLVRTDHLPQ